MAYLNYHLYNKKKYSILANIYLRVIHVEINTHRNKYLAPAMSKFKIYYIT